MPTTLPPSLSSVVTLLRDPARRERLGEAGRRFVQATYGWPAIVPKLKAVYHDLGVQRRGKPEMTFLPKKSHF